MRPVQVDVGRRVALLGVLCVATASCSESRIPGLVDPPVCPGVAKPAIVAYVTDYVSGAPIASGATLVLQEGAFVDSASFPSGQPGLDAQALATPRSYDRPGSYLVRVSRPGYSTAIVVSITVGSDGCHALTQTLNASLRPDGWTPTP